MRWCKQFFFQLQIICITHGYCFYDLIMFILILFTLTHDFQRIISRFFGCPVIQTGLFVLILMPDYMENTCDNKRCHILQQRQQPQQKLCDKIKRCGFYFQTILIILIECFQFLYSVFKWITIEFIPFIKKNSMKSFKQRSVRGLKQMCPSIRKKCPTIGFSYTIIQQC